MGTLSQWWMLAEAIVRYEREDPGVYELGDSNKYTVYVGSSIEVKSRLRRHVNAPSDSCIGNKASYYRVEYCSNYEQREVELYDKHVFLYGRPPECNDVRP